MLTSDWVGVPEDIEQYQGFVYILHDKVTGKKYIGQKVYWKKLRYPPLKGYKRVRVVKRESDWKSYLGSSDAFKELIKGREHQVIRRIIRNCRTKWEMSYYELKEQMDRDVLFKDEYMNGIINVRLGGNGRPK